MRAPSGRGEGAVQPGGQREVAEVVGGELALPSAVGELERGDRHHAGVVDQQVQRAGPRGGERRATLGEVDEVDVRHVHVGVAGGRGDVGRDPVPGGGVADREGDGRAGPGQRACGLHADAGGAAGDDRAGAGQVDALDDLVRGGGGVETGGDQGHGPILSRRW